MTYLIGTDEAGYGPNLGPLLVGATAWQLPLEDHSHDLYSMLSPVVSTAQVDLLSGETIEIADSKQLFAGRLTYARLERALFASIATLDMRPQTWKEIWPALCGEAADARQRYPWYTDFDAPLPIDADPTTIDRLAKSLLDRFDQSQVRLKQFVAKPVFPGEFNDQLVSMDNKANLLSAVTLGLVRQIVDQFDLPSVQADAIHPAVLVQCDKHGGRAKYAPMLQRHFPEYLVEIVSEGRRESVYRWGSRSGRIEFRFTAKGERFLPTALASIGAKYLRELAMLAFNQFWASHLEGIKPTAGYPVDAKRFRQEIRDVQRELGIDDRLVWRLK